jgi:hypothetical protein
MDSRKIISKELINEDLSEINEFRYKKSQGRTSKNNILEKMKKTNIIGKNSLSRK